METASPIYKATDYNFTFEKDIDLLIAKHQSYRIEFDMVRVNRYVQENSKNTIDYPCKTREDLIHTLENFADLIISVYPSKHYEEWDY